MSEIRRIDAGGDIAARLGTLGPRGLQAAARSLQRTGQEAIGYIQIHKLSKRGPKTLGRRSSNLARSVNATPPVIGPSSVSLSIGTNVEYAGVHEFGIDEPVTVRAHKRAQLGVLFGLPNPKAGEPYQVRQHKRRMKLPARRWLSAGLEEQDDVWADNLDEDLTAEFES